MLLPAVNTTIASSIISGYDVITFDDLSEKNEKPINANRTVFVFIFGFIIADAVIVNRYSFNNSFLYDCLPVEKVTVIGFGDYLTFPDIEVNPRFYMKTFVNVSNLVFSSSKEFEVSNGYQHFSLFVTPNAKCVLSLN
jgi:hypothetical protein